MSKKTSFSVQTRTQVLELGPRDLEPLHHDPHCILIDEDATDGDATDEDATNQDATEEDATDEDAMEEDAMEEDATDEDATDAHHPRCINPCA